MPTNTSEKNLETILVGYLRDQHKYEQGVSEDYNKDYALDTERMIHQFAEPDAASLDMLRMAMEKLKLSARAYNRILKVARTIADLERSENVQSQHIAEAEGYRNLDRGDWAERGI